MASNLLYPPTLDSYMPAFLISSGCNIYFSISKYNSSLDIKSLHVSIVKQGSNANMVNLKNDEGINEEGKCRYRTTGIILNVARKQASESSNTNLYYFTLTNDDIKGGFQPGDVYKIQIRLSMAADYSSSLGKGQNELLNENASSFSELSTVCTIKALGAVGIKIPSLDYDSTVSRQPESIVHKYKSPTLDIYGSFEDASQIDNKGEVLYLYNIKLYNLDTNKLIEESGDLYADALENINQFKLLSKVELEDDVNYRLVFNFITNNYYIHTERYNFQVSLNESIIENTLFLLTTENDSFGLDNNLLVGKTSIEKEQEEGRVYLKILDSAPKKRTCNICIRKSSSKDNFSTLEDMKIITVIGEYIEDLPPIYDYIIESGVYYKYGVQVIDADENRSNIHDITNPVMRDFEYSYLLGEDNRQLKLKFNNIINSYKIQLMESKLEPLGGTFPIITRNAALRYRLFPLTGLISFQMDDNHLFYTREEIYGKNSDLLKNKSTDKSYGEHNHFDKENHNYDYPKDGNNNLIDSPSLEDSVLNNSTGTSSLYQEVYDYIYERDFREKVLEFLHDGKPKLFKSPTEGNIIVRLTDINCTPNKSLDRMIYDFNCNANEIAEANTENYLKYNFYNIGEINRDLSKITIKLGQVQKNFNFNTNILHDIFLKYDGNGNNINGEEINLKKVYGVRITIEDKPLRVSVGNTLMLGNKLSVNNNSILILAPQRIYEFDSEIIFTDFGIDDSGIKFINTDDDNKETGVNATVDFLYELESKPYKTKTIKEMDTYKGLGQLFGNYKAGTKLYWEIYYKYWLESNLQFRHLLNITSIEIEARPGYVFEIKDAAGESSVEEHEINDTGTLTLLGLGNIKEINFKGIRNKSTGDVDTTINDEPLTGDMIINYTYTAVKGIYEKT